MNMASWGVEANDPNLLPEFGQGKVEHTPGKPWTLNGGAAYITYCASIHKHATSKTVKVLQGEKNQSMDTNKEGHASS